MDICLNNDILCNILQKHQDDLICFFKFISSDKECNIKYEWYKYIDALTYIYKTDTNIIAIFYYNFSKHLNKHENNIMNGSLDNYKRNFLRINEFVRESNENKPINFTLAICIWLYIYQ
jgi:hypothetical protein